MTTTRKLTGPAGTLDLRLPVGYASVTVDPDATQIMVTLSTPDDTGPSAEAINNTTGSVNDGQLLLQVPDIAAPGIVTGHRNGISIGSNHRGGTTIVTTGRLTIGNVIGGVFIDGDAFVVGNSPRAVSALPINAEVLLPAGAALSIHGTAVMAGIAGRLEALQVNTVSGWVRAESVADLLADTTSGDIEVEAVRSGRTVVHTVSGDVVIGSYQGHGAYISSVSGDVHLAADPEATGALTAKTVSGDLTLRGTGYLTVSATTVSGRKSIA